MSIINLCKILTYTSAIFSIVSLIIGSVFVKRIKTYLIPIFIVTSISAVVEIINFVFVTFVENNLFVFHIFTILEFTLLTLFYSYLLKNHINSQLFYIFIALFITMAFFDYKINGLKSIDSLSSTVESIFLVSSSLVLFFFMIYKKMLPNLLASPIFWVNSGVLIYFSGNIFLFAFSNYLYSTEIEKYAILWALLHSSLNIIYNTCLSTAFWKTRTN